VKGIARYPATWRTGHAGAALLPRSVPRVAPEICARSTGQPDQDLDKILNSLLYDPRQLIDGISNERYCATNNSLTGSRELGWRT